jgi:hypothetical protein
MNGSGKIDFDNLRPEEFERYLPELFANTEGKVSDDPRLQGLFASYPDCLELVRDLETIAQTARSLLEPVEDPSDQVWTNIQSKLLEETGGLDLDEEVDLEEEEDSEDESLPNGGKVKK